MGLEDLDEVIRRSRTRAAPFVRGLFGSSTLDALGVQQLVNRRREVTVAVVTGKGHPHAALVVAGCVDGRIVFTASTGSLLLKSLGDRAPVSLTCSEEAGSGIMIRGEARRVGHYREIGRLRAELDELTARGYFVDAGWDGYIYEVVPETIFGELT